ncbi:MAG: hypothetical protein Q9171_006862 [Xanthocarpia ochracea]
MRIAKLWPVNLWFTYIELGYTNPTQPNNRILPILSPNGAAANLSLPSTNLSNDPVPAEFTMTCDLILPIPFTEEAAFINIVHAMKEIAHGDFHGVMRDVKFRTDRYPEPVVWVQTTSVGTVKRKYVLWGLYETLKYLYSILNFAHSHFTLLWDDEEVGGIGLGSPRADHVADYRTIDTTSHQNEDNQSLAGRDITNKTTTLGPETQNPNLTDLASRLSVVFGYRGGRPMDKEDMFIGILRVFVSAAIPPSNQRIRFNWGPSDTADTPCKFTIASTIQTEPPFLQFYWVVEAVARAADYLVAKDRYQLLSMVLKVDDVKIGGALLFHRQSASREDVTSV